MNPSSEERLRDEAAKSKPVSARILPFERPPTSLQRAVQERAQEAMERDRERSKRRPAPLKWTVICVLALVPVLTLVFAVDAFVRLFQHINETYIQADAPADAQPTDQPQSAQPEPAQQEPGVVMLQPFEEPARPSETDAAQPNQ